MNIGFYSCIILVPCFLVIGLLCILLKGKAAKFVSGFCDLSKQEQDMCDKDWLIRDLRNSCFLWAFILFVGAILSYLLTAYMAVVAYIIWGVLFFKDVHLDAHKAFEKYLLK